MDRTWIFSLASGYPPTHKRVVAKILKVQGAWYFLFTRPQIVPFLTGRGCVFTHPAQQTDAPLCIGFYLWSEENHMSIPPVTFGVQGWRQATEHVLYVQKMRITHACIYVTYICTGTLSYIQFKIWTSNMNNFIICYELI